MAAAMHPDPFADIAERAREYATSPDADWHTAAHAFRAALRLLAVDHPDCFPGEPGECGSGWHVHAAGLLGTLLVAVNFRIDLLGPKGQQHAQAAADFTARTLAAADADVSHETSWAGRGKCSRCDGPRDAAPPGRRPQRYCSDCRTQYMREWRAGKTEIRLTDEEREMVMSRRSEQEPEQ